MTEVHDALVKADPEFKCSHGAEYMDADGICTCALCGVVTYVPHIEGIGATLTNQWVCMCGNTTSLIDVHGAYCPECEWAR